MKLSLFDVIKVLFNKLVENKTLYYSQVKSIKTTRNYVFLQKEGNLFENTYKLLSDGNNHTFISYVRNLNSHIIVITFAFLVFPKEMFIHWNKFGKEYNKALQ